MQCWLLENSFPMNMSVIQIHVDKPATSSNYEVTFKGVYSPLITSSNPNLKKRKEKGNSTSFELNWNTVLDIFQDLKCLYERFKQKSVWVQTGHLYFVGVAYIFGSADKMLLHIPKTTWRSLDQTPGKNPLLFKITCVWTQGLLPLCNSCHG